MSSGILVGVRPIDDSRPAQLVLQVDDARTSYDLSPGLPLTITADTSTKYCVGWHDVNTHSAHICEQGATVDQKHEQCYQCRQKTDFNPAFYNTTDISDKQIAYNSRPHSVYVAYFGDDLVKAGISADSRGLRRLREQGALLYAIIDSFPSAEIARYHEANLISAGLRGSVSRRQKAKALESVINQQAEAEKLQTILAEHGYADRPIMDQLDDYFYNAYPDAGITPVGDRPVSGSVRGVVGRYLVLNNNQHLYGIWLNSLLGYQLTIDESVADIDPPQQQISLF